MAIDIDGKDYIVQFTEAEGGQWKGSEVFADPYSAKQHSMHLLHGEGARSVRVVQTRLYGWRQPDGTFGWEDDIGDREDEQVNYNKRVATGLCDELIETVKRIAESVKAGPDEGPLVDQTCERLGRAISDLKTTIRL